MSPNTMSQTLTTPQILVRHKVRDYEAWKRVFDDHSTTRASHGSKGGRLFRNADDASEVFMLLEVEDLDRARDFITSDDLREKMAEAGVTDQPDIYLLDPEEAFEA